MSHTVESITYFAEEGKANLNDCLRLSFETAARFGLSKVVIFTGVGDGVEQALERYVNLDLYAGILPVAVTFPQGFEIKVDGGAAPHHFPDERRSAFAQQGVRIVRAHLPLNSISMQHQNTGVLAQDLGIVGNALNIFCGSMSLCVQAALVACDAGELGLGEHVVVMTSDTALLVRAAPTARLLTDFIVRQIICKPAFLTIIKNERPLLTDTSEESVNDFVEEQQENYLETPEDV